MFRKIYKVRVNRFYSNENESESRSEEYIWYHEGSAKEYLESRRDAAYNKLVQIPASVIIDSPDELLVMRITQRNEFTTLRVEHVTLETIIV